MSSAASTAKRVAAAREAIDRSYEKEKRLLGEVTATKEDRARMEQHMARLQQELSELMADGAASAAAGSGPTVGPSAAAGSGTAVGSSAAVGSGTAAGSSAAAGSGTAAGSSAAAGAAASAVAQFLFDPENVSDEEEAVLGGKPKQGDAKMDDESSEFFGELGREDDQDGGALSNVSDLEAYLQAPDLQVGETVRTKLNGNWVMGVVVGSGNGVFSVQFEEGIMEMTAEHLARANRMTKERWAGDTGRWDGGWVFGARAVFGGSFYSSLHLLICEQSWGSFADLHCSSSDVVDTIDSSTSIFPDLSHPPGF